MRSTFEYKQIFYLGLILFLLPSLSKATYLEVYATHIVEPGGNVSVHGRVVNTRLEAINGINVSAVVGASTGSDITDSNGYFSFNLTAPSSPGLYEMVVTTNETTPNTKHLEVYVTYVSGGRIDFVGNIPPFPPGSSFLVNVTLLNGSSPLTNYKPNISIHSLNGPPVKWNIQNLSVVSDELGVMRYNITIPPNTSAGQYVIVVERRSYHEGSKGSIELYNLGSNPNY